MYTITSPPNHHQNPPINLSELLSITLNTTESPCGIIFIMKDARVYSWFFINKHDLMEALGGIKIEH